MSITDEPAIAELMGTLTKLNGVDQYVPALMPDTALVGDKAMHIPVSLFTKVHVQDVTKIGTSSLLSSVEVFHVASVNFDSLVKANHPHAAEVSVLRALIASRGFSVEANPIKDGDLITAKFCKKPEIVAVKDNKKIGLNEAGIITRIDAVYLPLVNRLKDADNEDFTKMVALLPTFAAIEFQKTNHHYVDDEFYKETYARHFKSAQLKELEPKWNRISIIYDAVHWLGPWNMEHYKENLRSNPSGLLPRGIAIKSRPAPAGTALCRTQVAVWKAIAVYPGGQQLINMYGSHIAKMNALADAIDKDRLSYHVYASLFNKLSKLELPETIDAMSACGQLAAIAQAFIDTVAKGTDLARARALRKHAEQNIALFKLASAAFKGTLRKIEKEATVSAIINVLKADMPKSAIIPRTTLPEVVPEEEPEE
jgi:hypothetical protein